MFGPGVRLVGAADALTVVGTWLTYRVEVCKVTNKEKWGHVHWPNSNLAKDMS